MKQMHTVEKVIGENHFYIRPFPAFTAANISGDLAAILTPLLGSPASILDIEAKDALSAISEALSGLTGAKFERLMRTLPTKYGNISVQGEATDETVQLMDYSTANEVFCGEVQDMYILSFEVIKLNFKGFFKKIGGQFGSLKDMLQTGPPSSNNGENSITAASPALS